MGVGMSVTLVGNWKVMIKKEGAEGIDWILQISEKTKKLFCRNQDSNLGCFGHNEEY